ncbi:hypothetical protein Bbelb_084070 [Branchiostoma belcheri]|nr:hypothetical protein Bbelb_084070 [Branchiostoma belcheri]
MEATVGEEHGDFRRSKEDEDSFVEGTVSQADMKDAQRLAEVVQKHRELLVAELELTKVLQELKGHELLTKRALRNIEASHDVTCAILYSVCLLKTPTWVSGRFGTWLVRHWTFGHLDIWVPGQFGTWTVQHIDSSAPGQFGTWTVRHLDISAPGQFGTWTVQRLDSSAPGQFGTWTVRHPAPESRTSAASRQRQNEAFLQALLEAGPGAFQTFCDALVRTNQSRLEGVLRAESPAESPGSLTNGVDSHGGSEDEKARTPESLDEAEYSSARRATEVIYNITQKNLPTDHSTALELPPTGHCSY